jgi:type VI secretion system protein ImpL
MGMINFLRDFRSGLRQFHADEFPSAKAGLDALAVRQIAVRYAFDGQDVVLKIAQQLDAYDKQQKESLLEKQKSEETLLRLSQEDIQQKLAAQSAPAGSARSAADASLPEQIGVCWDEKAASDRGGNVQAVVNGLARNADTGKKAGARPAAKAASGSRPVSTKPSRQ